MRCRTDEQHQIFYYYYYFPDSFPPFFGPFKVILPWKLRLKLLWQLPVWDTWVSPGTQDEADESIQLDLGFNTGPKSSKQDDTKCWSLCSVLLKKFKKNFKNSFLKRFVFTYSYRSKAVSCPWREQLHLDAWPNSNLYFLRSTHPEMSMKQHPTGLWLIP